MNGVWVVSGEFLDDVWKVSKWWVIVLYYHIQAACDIFCLIDPQLQVHWINIGKYKRVCNICIKQSLFYSKTV